MAKHRQADFPTADLPYPDTLVHGGRENAMPVRTKHHGSHPILMAAKASYLAARLHIPQLDEPVTPPGEEIASIGTEGHTGPLSSVAFSPDGRYLLSGGSDRLIKLWDVQTRSEIRSFRGHKDWVTSVMFSPDGHRVLSAAVDQSVRVWEIGGREVSLSMFGHAREVNVVAISPDGKLLASGS